MNIQKIWLILIILCTLGCTKRFEMQSDEYYQYQYDMYEQEMSGGGGLRSKGAPAPDDSYAYKSAPGKKRKSEAIAMNDYEQQEGQEQAQSTSRMIHYNGYANLQVARPEETIEEIVTVAKNVDGNIERRSTKSITIRVPKESFNKVFNQILDLGEVSF